MKTLLKNALVMCAIVTATASTINAACQNGSCSIRATTKSTVAARRTTVVKRTQPKRSAQPVRRGGCANGQCNI